MKCIFWRNLLSIIVVIVSTGCNGRDFERDEVNGLTPEAATFSTVTAEPTEPSSITLTTAPAESSISVTPTAPASTATLTATVAPTPPASPLSGEQLVLALQRGGYVLYFRHASTDPVPDDANPVDFSDCSTQRNLSAEGRAQASALGQAIEKLEIPIGSVLSSPFCRALETAQLAFGKAVSEPVLENLETAESETEREARVQGLQSLLSAPPGGRANNVLVGHGFNINAAAGITIAEGEAAIFRPEGGSGFTLVATLKPGKWEEL